MDEDERELQIRLAEIQTDIQMDLAALFGFGAIIVGLVIGCLQLAYSVNPALKHLFIILAAIGTVCWFIVEGLLTFRMQSDRKKISKLRGKK
jgi:ABC-type branched-subunit amino acid transport system permease subunit